MDPQPLTKLSAAINFNSTKWPEIQNPKKTNTTMNTHEKTVSALLCFISSIVDKSFIIKVL